MNNSKYVDATILILGGGTSTLDAKWENLQYDYIWTCNEFYLEPRILNQDIDLYLLSYPVKLTNLALISKLTGSSTNVVFEPFHYRGKQNTREFKSFVDSIEIPVVPVNLPNVSKQESPASLSGATFRLILAALEAKAGKIYFAGFDGFNKQFTNKHAFTKHPGLKDSDTRRTYQGTKESYVSVFTEAYKWFLKYPNYKVLQNLGEGFDYNIGTSISKENFPLTKEVYEKIR